MARTMRIAYFSPLAPARSSVSDYSEELLPQLCRRAHVDVYTDDGIAAAQEVGRVYPLYGYRDFSQRERYDHLVFQLGNSPEYVPIYDELLRSGGVVALHDLDLTEVVGARSLRQGDGWGYLQEVRRNEGLGPFLRTAGDALRRRQWPGPQWEGLERRGQVDRHGRPDRQSRSDGQSRLAMSRAVARKAAGLIVHSEAERQQLLARYPEARVRHVPLSIRRPPAIDAAEARQSLDLPPDAFICIAVGRLCREKRIHVAMQAFARLLERCPDSLFVLVGDLAPDYPLPELAHTLGIADRVRLTGYVDLATLYRYLAASDVGISLRTGDQGEMSASLLRIMSMGRPVVASNCAPNAPMPDDCALKVDSGVAEVAHTAAALWALCGHAPMRRWYGQQAARYVQANHAATATARHYIEFLEELATVQAAEEILLREEAPSRPAASPAPGLAPRPRPKPTQPERWAPASSGR